MDQVLVMVTCSNVEMHKLYPDIDNSWSLVLHPILIGTVLELSMSSKTSMKLKLHQFLICPTASGASFRLWGAG